MENWSGFNDTNFYANVRPTDNRIVEKRKNTLPQVNNNSHVKMASYSSAYQNINGKERMGEQKIVSDGNKTKMYRNIDGKEDQQEFKGVPYSRHFTHTPLNQQNNILDLIERNHTTNRVMLPNLNTNSIFDRFFDDKQIFNEFESMKHISNDPFFKEFFDN